MNQNNISLERVIKGLECCLEGLSDLCSYKDSDAPGGCKDELMYDALALLKAQEPIAPIEHYIPDEAHMRKSLAWECGNCLIDIGYGVNYCYNCGRPVKWE